MKTVAPMKSSEIRALLEGKRDEINLLLPTVAPAVGLARVERDGDNYIMRIGENIVVRRGLFTKPSPWASIGADGKDNFICTSLNDAIIRALPNDARAEFKRELSAG